jgi:hypothetical protein
MKEFELASSPIPAEMAYNMLENYDMAWAADRVAGLYRVVFMTIAEILKHYKSKKEPVGFILKDNNGAFKFGAILTYHEPEEGEANEDDDKGNYTLEFTIKEDDLKDIHVVADNHSDIFVDCSGRKAAQIMNGRFINMESCNCLFIESIDTLVKFLDANASEAEEVAVVYRGIFTATVAVEGGEKVIDIVPGEMVKQYIKGDSAL